MRVSHILNVIICILLLTALPATVEAKNFIVVLDPGHGGHDPGTHGSTAKEKNVVLSISNKIRDLLSKHKDITVETTRTTDSYVTLDRRAYKANHTMCDIFISIHCNSVDSKNPRRNTIAGATVYSMSKDRSTENLEIVKKENSVVELDKLYAPKEQTFASDELAILSELNQTNNIHHSVLAANIIQRELVETAGRNDLGTKKAGFLVLRKTTRPAVLVEVDYLCNPTVERFLSSETGKNKIAKAIYKGIVTYKQALETGNPISDTDSDSAPTATDEDSGSASATSSAAAEEYRIQILTSSKRIKDGSPKFKGLKPIDSYTDGKTIKYTYGHYPSRPDAAADLKRIKSWFRDAFIIKVRNGKRIN